MRRIIDIRTGQETVDNDFVKPNYNPTVDDKRDAAKLPKREFVKQLFRAGIMNNAQAEAAARGDWPAAFTAALAGKSASVITEAKIDWGGATEVHYRHPLLGEVALAIGGSPTAATALLDQIFGIA